MREVSHQADAIRESIAEEVRSATIIYKDLLLDWQNFSAYAETLIEEAESVITQAENHETLMPDEVMEMELTVIETQKLAAEKKRDLVHALIDLQYAMGIEFPTGEPAITQ